MLRPLTPFPRDALWIRKFQGMVLHPEEPSAEITSWEDRRLVRALRALQPSETALSLTISPWYRSIHCRPACQTYPTLGIT